MNARAAAIASRATTYRGGRQCIYGHGDERYTSSGACVECAKQASATRARDGYFANRYAAKRASILERMRTRYLENPSAAVQRARAWCAANPSRRRAISNRYKAMRRSKEDAGISGGVLAAWTRIQPRVCFYCGKDCKDAFHIDHFMPLARGGAHVLTNLRIACVPCNLHKSNRDPRAWIESVTPEMVMP